MEKSRLLCIKVSHYESSSYIAEIVYHLQHRVARSQEINQNPEAIVKFDLVKRAQGHPVQGTHYTPTA